MRFLKFLKKNAFLFVMLTALGAYVVISGTTGTCPTCVAITQAAGIPSIQKAGVVNIAPTLTDTPLTVGDSIPSGTLYRDTGEGVELKELILSKPTVLIFYRGGWCPYCNRHLAALADIEEALKEAGFQMFAISPDRPGVLRSKEKLKDLSYTLLSDSSMDLAKQFGIAFQVPDELVSKYKNSYSIDIEADSGETHHLLPHPSVYIVDTGGKIRFTYVNEDYKVRLEPEKILAAVEAIKAEQSDF